MKEPSCTTLSIALFIVSILLIVCTVLLTTQSRYIINRGPYFSNFKGIEEMLEKTNSQLSHLPEYEQWRSVDTLCTAFNYFYKGKKITYEQILPSEELWAQHLDGIIGVAQQPILAAIKKGLIEKAMPVDLKLMPNTSQEVILQARHFIGDVNDSTFSVEFALKHLNGVYSTLEYLERPLTPAEMLKTTGDLKARLFMKQCLQDNQCIKIADSTFLQWFGNDASGLFALLQREAQFKITPKALNLLFSTHQFSPGHKEGIKFLQSICTLLRRDGLYINGRFSKTEFKTLSDKIAWWTDYYADFASDENMGRTLKRLQELIGN